MNNLGISNARVEILDGLPHISTETSKYNFDVFAANWPLFLNSPVASPLLVENLSDAAGTFDVIYPSKRRSAVDNFMVGADKGVTENKEDKVPQIFWKVVSEKPNNALVKYLLEDFPKQSVIQPENYSQNMPANYDGPKWKNDPLEEDPQPDDLAYIGEWKTEFGISEKKKTNETKEAAKVTTYYVTQEKVRAGLWWGIISNSFLEKDQPFWVNFRRKVAPSTDKYDTFLVISLGVGKNSRGNSFDIYLSNNVKPRIIDYVNGRGKKPRQTEFDIDLSKVLTNDTNIEVGVMTIAGRLVVYVNKVPMVYTRIDPTETENEGKIGICEIPSGVMQIWGSNAQTSVNVSAMSFAQVGAFCVQIPAFKEDGKEIDYKGCSPKGEPSGSVCLIPNHLEKIYGVDCAKFEQVGGASAEPEGDGFHQQGIIRFKPAAKISKNLPSDYYFVLMYPEDFSWAKQNVTVSYGGVPYFYRLKGLIAKESPQSQGGSVKVEDVISVSQTDSAPDYFHIKKSASVVLYNRDARWDFLKKTQVGIRISFGWNGEYETSFTGVTLRVKTSETPGMETLTLECEDYMHILNSTPIVNSPYYDGMLMYYAVKDLAERGGMARIEKDWDNEDEYFLPSGYSFTKPSMRFNSFDMIFKCIINIVQRAEAYVYFDEEGVFHINKLAGGLFSEFSSANASFTKNPDSSDPGSVILDEKAEEWSLQDTYNKISIMTIDRNTRNIIIIGTTAGSENNLRFKKVKLIDQGALGSLEVAKAWMYELAKRIFYPIRKVGIKTVGQGNTFVRPLDFALVDGLEYRLMAVTRRYDANNNDFTSEYQFEWLGGK